MKLSFNTTGPCVPGEHYMLPPERRLGRILELIEYHKYFTLHAGRQTGKTTSAQWLVEHLNREGHFRAVWVDIQVAREQPDPVKAFEIILYCLDVAIGRDVPDLGVPADDVRRVEGGGTFILQYLRDLAARSDKPLVVLFDEVDGLVGPTMISFLTQLRQGYLDRNRIAFPSSVVLIGQRQPRDYVLSAEERRAVVWLGTTSPFNVNAESTTLGSFTEPEVTELLSQHTAATGQPFAPEAARRIWALGQGHPWLTNALADQIVGRDLTDRSATVTAAHVDAAKETIILERRSHIDSLIARLREPRVQRVLDPMLMGGQTGMDVMDDDIAYVIGLGLIRVHQGRFEIANPIYREVVPRTLTFIRQAQVPAEPAWYVRADGSLDMAKLFTDWQTFWRKDGHLAAEGFGYREAGPHLMLMAFLQRVVNGGGRVEREYGLGRGALDLMICWREDRHVIEVKVRRDTETEIDALDQVARYLDHTGLPEGWLVMFDLRKERSWAEKLYVREVDHQGKTIRLVGC